MMMKTVDVSKLDFLSNIIYILKYQRSTSLGSQGIRIRKSQFVTKTQFLCMLLRKIKTKGATRLYEITKSHELKFLSSAINKFSDKNNLKSSL